MARRLRPGQPVVTSPTVLSLRHLREQGADPIAVVEHWIPIPGLPGRGKRRDLFGLFDILAIHQGDTIAIQTTTASNVSARAHKIGDSPHLPAIRAAGWTI